MGKRGINIGIRNKLFWRHYFGLCKEKFMSTEKEFNDFIRMYCSTSLGKLRSHDLIDDGILRKFKNDIEGCRYLMLMMVRLNRVPCELWISA